VTQPELLYRKVVVSYPPTGGSARRPIRVRADDGLDYMLKDDSGGAPVRAREWICHGLADNAGLPVLECRPDSTLRASESGSVPARILYPVAPPGPPFKRYENWSLSRQCISDSLISSRWIRRDIFGGSRLAPQSNSEQRTWTRLSLEILPFFN
jgi:hypothetical protein